MILIIIIILMFILVIATIIFYYYCSKILKRMQELLISEIVPREPLVIYYDPLLWGSINMIISASEDKRYHISSNAARYSYNCFPCRGINMAAFNLGSLSHLEREMSPGNEFGPLSPPTWLSWRHAKNTDEKVRPFLQSHIIFHQSKEILEEFIM